MKTICAPRCRCDQQQEVRFPIPRFKLRHYREPWLALVREFSRADHWLPSAAGLRPRFLRIDSPLSSMRCALCTKRSMMLSAMLGSPICSCQCATGIWLAGESWNGAGTGHHDFQVAPPAVLHMPWRSRRAPAHRCAPVSPAENRCCHLREPRPGHGTIRPSRGRQRIRRGKALWASAQASQVLPIPSRSDQQVLMLPDPIAGSQSAHEPVGGPSRGDAGSRCPRSSHAL